MVYPQLVRKNLSDHSKEYRIVNDAFIFVVIQFTEVDYAKRMSKKATAKIIEIGAYYIQFKTFNYLRVASTTINQNKLPRYLCDRLDLLEIA